MDIRTTVRADDIQNPITDACAKELAARTPVTEIPFDVPYGTTWLIATPEYREWFRERARRFLIGDTSVLPVTWPTSSRVR